jgi:hypothetical protein
MLGGEDGPAAGPAPATGDRRRHATTRPGQARAGGDPTNPARVVGCTKLAGPANWTWFSRDPILGSDWRSGSGGVAAGAAAALRRAAAGRGIANQQVKRVGARCRRPGTSMTARPVAMLLADRGLPSPTPAPTSQRQPGRRAPGHDLTHHPTLPERFGCIQTPAGAAGGSSLVQPPAPPQRHRAADPPRSTTAPPSRSATPRPGAGGRRGCHPERFVGTPPSRLGCPARSGSTSPSTHSSRLSNYPADLSHRG